MLSSSLLYIHIQQNGARQKIIINNKTKKNPLTLLSSSFCILFLFRQSVTFCACNSMNIFQKRPKVCTLFSFFKIHHVSPQDFCPAVKCKTLLQVKLYFSNPIIATLERSLNQRIHCCKMQSVLASHLCAQISMFQFLSLDLSS